DVDIEMGEVRGGFAPQQIDGKDSFVDECNRMPLNTLIVHVVVAGQSLVVDFAGMRVVDDGKEVGKNAALEVGVEFAARTRRHAQLRTNTCDVGRDDAFKQSRG